MRNLLFLVVAVTGSLTLLSCGSTDSTTNFQVSISASPSEGGTVSPSSGQHEEGTSLDISATPSEEYRFVKWQGDYEGNSNSATISVDSDKNIEAIFAKKEYNLTINIKGEGTVAESVVQTTSTADYESGTIIELTANPVDGWKLVEWQGAITSTENPTQITVDEAKEVTAVFEKESFALNINTEGEGSVTISPNHDEYTFETEIELTANADQNWEFSEWSGDISETENPLTITVKNALSITAIFSNTTFAGGNGTEANPYKISTLEQLQAINDYPEAHFIQINDIDASTTKNWNQGKGFIPIGDDIVNFKGSFEGNENSISNLFINRPNRENIGLFGYISSGANLNNINLVAVNITGDYSVGGLTGFIEEGSIVNCSVSGEVNGSGTVGGLVGWNRYKMVVNHSSSSAKIEGNNTVGGLVGSNYTKSKILNSFATGDVSGSNSVGGLVGQNFFANIENSFATGNVNGQRDYVGGLVGTNHRGCKVSNSYSIGNVSGDKHVGGLAGRILENCTISNSYSHGNVNGNKLVGGLLGSNSSEGIVSGVYSIGDVDGNLDVGALIGANGGIVNSSYWNVESQSQNNSVGRGNDDGTTGLTNSEMTGRAAETNMPDFDWSEIWVTTDNYPILFWE